MAALEQKLPSITNAAGASTSHHLDSEATFRKLWKHSTEDNNLALYGFRRFKTSHLLNLRYLEEEISRLDYDMTSIKPAFDQAVDWVRGIGWVYATANSIQSSPKLPSVSPPR
jgi:hypothetical protein